MSISDTLAGFTVLDVSQGIAGPYCAQLLGDLGARVIKIEPPEGDWGRRAGERVGGSSSMFEVFNRGKEGLVLDLKTPRGLAGAKRLAAHADVFIENARVGSMQRLGLGYDVLRAINPALVCTSISGFGQRGPYASRPATDTVMQSYTGLAVGASGTGWPVRLRVAFVDLVTGIYASHATVAALLKRLKTGSGQHLDISLAHAMASLQNYKIVDEAVQGTTGQAEAFAVIGIFEARDGAFAISAASDRQVLATLSALGCGELVDDPRFSAPESRQANQALIRERMSAKIALRTVDECMQVLEAAGVPCQRVLSYTDLMRDAQVRALGLFQWIDTCDAVSIPIVRAPGLDAAALGGASGPTSRAPALGEHTNMILAEFQREPR